MVPFHNRSTVLASLMMSVVLLITISVPLQANSMTLDEAVQRALDEDLDRTVVQQKLQAWKQKADRTGQWNNPTLSASGASDQPTNDRGKEVLSLELSQPFPVTQRIHQQQTISKLEWKQARAELREYDRNLILTVKQTYSSLVHKNKILAVYNRQIERLNTIVELGQDFLDRGELSRLELNMMEMERDTIKTRRDRIKQELIDKRGTMKNVLNLSADEEFRVTPKPSELNNQFQQTVDTTVRPRRPDLRKRQLALNKLRAELDREQSRGWDDWVVSMGYDREETIGGSEEKTVNLGLSIPFPLWDQNDAMRAFKQEMIASAETSVQALRRTISRKLTTLEDKISLQQRTVERYNQTVLPRTQRQENLSIEGFEQGLIKPSEFLRINTQLFDARRAHYRELLRLTELYFHYEHTTGTTKHLKTDFLKERSQ